jgi:hypothetical protein
LVVKRKDQALSVAAQAMLELIEKQIGPIGPRHSIRGIE